MVNNYFLKTPDGNFIVLLLFEYNRLLFTITIEYNRSLLREQRNEEEEKSKRKHEQMLMHANVNEQMLTHPNVNNSMT